MNYTDVIILIPSHSLEDFPTEQNDGSAAGLLNSFAVAWHPQFLAGMPQLPRWHRADDPPAPQSGQLFFVPEVCDGWLPHGWQESARAAGAVVVDQVQDREEMIERAFEGSSLGNLAEDLVADFLALGTCWLQVELLTRHMRNFGNIDEIRLQNRAIAAAKAVVAHDRETAEAHLRSSFEVLLDARERFYPVDCYLLDLTLVVPDVADDALLTSLQAGTPVNLLIHGHDLAVIADQRPDILAALRTAVAAGTACVLGAEHDETATPLLPMNSWLRQVERGWATFESLLGQRPRVWGRRRFGLHNAWPQVLQKSGYVGALHVGLDDGLYPDAEHSRFRWQGSDESIVEAFSRIPLAAESAATFLRFPVRMAESMDHDHVAGLCLARWPAVKAPFLEDLRRSQKYAAVVGKFATFEQFFTANGTPGRMTQHPASGYFTPFLLQHVARREADPLTRYADHALRRLRWDAADTCYSLAAALLGQPLNAEERTTAEASLETGGPDRSEGTSLTAVESELQSWEHLATRKLAKVVLSQARNPGTGLLILNPFRFPRRYTFRWPENAVPPAVTGNVKAVDGGLDGVPTDVTVDIPGCGFVWLSTASQPASLPANARKLTTNQRKLPAPEPGVLRNDRWEISIHEGTGGIAQVRHPLKRENRFSQLVSFRFAKERKLPSSDDRPDIRSQYAETRCLGIQPVRSDGAILELESTGEIVDQLTNRRLAAFRQRTRIYRHRPNVDFDIELSEVVVPESDPWNQYFCVRFAWDSSSAALTRSWLDTAQEVGGDRIESTQYLEIADENERLTIIPHGLPFHRKSGVRMVDSLLIVAGETRRRFQFTVAMDQPYPLEAAWDVMVPPFVIPTEQAFASPQSSGWLLSVDARNVQVLSLRELTPPPATDSGPKPPGDTNGFCVRIMETEGRPRTVRLATYGSPIFTRKCDWQLQTLPGCELEGDAIRCDLQPYEIATIEVHFG